MVGSRMTVGEVVASVMKDRMFFEDSGGGVTFSGGEPLGQPEFLQALLAAFRSREITTAVDTAGLCTPQALLEAAPLRWIGRLSYSLYIWQQLFLAPSAGHWWQVFPLNLGLAFGAAWISYRWIELPLLAVGKRFGRSGKKAREMGLRSAESVPA